LVRAGCANVLRATVSGYSFAGRCAAGLAAALWAVASAAGQSAEPPLQFRAEGSMPVEYTDTRTPSSHQSGMLGAPYLGLSAEHRIESGLIAEIFIDGGHAPLGQFRDNDSSFVSFGGNIIKRWEALSVGVGYEHTYFYTGIFGPLSNIANDFNVFSRYQWNPNSDLKLSPFMDASARLDDSGAVQRTSVGGRVDIERRLFGSWWAVATPRLRYYDYAGGQAGRRDLSASIVAGVKYEFNDNVSARMVAGYENRTSNIDSNHRDRLTAGVSLDFNFVAGRRW
jgi:hypothetical protein